MIPSAASCCGAGGGSTDALRDEVVEGGAGAEGGAARTAGVLGELRLRAFLALSAYDSTGGFWGADGAGDTMSDSGFFLTTPVGEPLASKKKSEAGAGGDDRFG